MARKIIDWKALRTAYEAGETVSRLSQVNTIKMAEIRARAAAEGWGRNESEELLKLEWDRQRAEAAKRAAAAGAIYALPAEERAALAHELMTRYLRGEFMSVMGRELRVSRQVLYNILLGGMDDVAQKELVTQALAARIAHADEMLEAATTNIEVSKWDRLGRAAREDLNRRRWAEAKGVDLAERLRRADFGEQLRLARERSGLDRPGRVVEAEVKVEKVEPDPAPTPPPAEPEKPKPLPAPERVPDWHWSVIPGAAYTARHGRRKEPEAVPDPKGFED